MRRMESHACDLLGGEWLLYWTSRDVLVPRGFLPQLDAWAGIDSRERALSIEPGTPILIDPADGLKRNKLTHKHTDLKDRFYAERRAREGMRDREAKLHKEIARLKARIDELRGERDNYRTANEVFARALHALTVENDNLRRNTSGSRTAHLTSIDPVRRRPDD
jgi:hypothetical protein